MAKVEKNSHRGGSKKGERRGGRQKGTPNKKTLEFAEELNRLDFNALEKAVELFENTQDDSIKANIIINLLKYLYPQRKAVDLNSSQNEGLEIKITRKEI